MCHPLDESYDNLSSRFQGQELIPGISSLPEEYLEGLDLLTALLLNPLFDVCRTCANLRIAPVHQSDPMKYWTQIPIFLSLG
jgi:hypothetical protein